MVKNKSKILKYIVYSFCALLIFSVTHSNVLKQYTAKNMFPYGEHWLSGSILKARQDGLFSTGTFTAAWLPHGGNLFDLHYHSGELYKSEKEIASIPKKEWSVYRSALRIPTTFFVVMDWIHYKITGTPKDLFPFYRFIIVLLFTTTIGLFLFWAGENFGLFTAFGLSILLCYCSFFLGDGRYLSGATWIDFFPFFLGLHLFSGKFKWFHSSKRLHLFLYGFFSTILVASDSYEWIPVIMMGLLLPPIFYNEINAKELKKLISTFVVIGIGALSGFVVILFIHFLMTAYIEGGIVNAIEFFRAKFFFRTSGDTTIIETKKTLQNVVPVDDETKNRINAASLLSILKTYFTDKSILASFTAAHLVSFLVLSFPFLLFKSDFFPLLTKNKTKLIRLFLLTIGGLLAATSFFIVFKGHAVFHEFMDYYAFSISFLPLFIVYFLAILQLLVLDLWNKLPLRNYSLYPLFYILMLLPILIPLNKKYNLISLEKIEFIKKDAILFDLFNEGNYSFNLGNGVQLNQNELSVQGNPMSMYLNLDASQIVSNDLVLKLRFNSDPHGILRIYYDKCIQDNFIKEYSTTHRVSYGDNLIYIEIEAQKCVEELRIDFINNSYSSIQIDELIIK